MGTNSRIIRRCMSLPEAYACAGLLKANGFLASLENEHHAALDWGMIPALGGIKILVPASQYDSAKTCIIGNVTAARAEHPEPVKMTLTNRLKAVSMLLIFFGIVEVLGVIVLLWLNTIIPPEWIPDSGQTYSYFTISSGHGVGPPGPGRNGAVLMFFIIVIVVSELITTQPKKTRKDTQV